MEESRLEMLEDFDNYFDVEQLSRDTQKVMVDQLYDFVEELYQQWCICLR